MIADYLLKIFRAAIPHMPKTAAGFGHDLQLALQPMILKPSAGLNVSVLFFSVAWHSAELSAQGLQETVACMCAVVQCLTRDFLRLVNLLKSCNGITPRVSRFPRSHPLQDSSRSLLRSLPPLNYRQRIIGAYLS